MNSFYEFKENIYNLRNKSCLKAENVRTVAYGIGPLMQVGAKLWEMVDTLRKRCPYSEFFGPVFSRIQTEYGEIGIELKTERYSVLSVCSPNAWKYGPEKLRVWTLFAQW